jgi:hypothetical protein
LRDIFDENKNYLVIIKKLHHKTTQNQQMLKGQIKDEDEDEKDKEKEEKDKKKDFP